MEHVHRAFVEKQGLDSGPAQQPETPAVVVVVAAGTAVEIAPVVRRRMIDETHPVSAILEFHERDFGCPFGGERIRDRELLARGPLRNHDAAV